MYVLCLGPLFPRYDVKGNHIALFNLISTARSVNEDVCAAISGRDEAKTLRLIEKLHGAFIHFRFLLCQKCPCVTGE